jgi:hypothetical protein
LISRSDLLDRLYACAFWGDPVHLAKFIQIYSVEKAKLEARKRGYQVSEQALQDGSIKVQIIEASHS